MLHRESQSNVGSFYSPINIVNGHIAASVSNPVGKKTDAGKVLAITNVPANRRRSLCCRSGIWLPSKDQPGPVTADLHGC
jgi:hypothetical protein